MLLKRRKACRITVDPGLGGTGWAVWESGSVWPTLVMPVATGVIRAGGPTSWILRSNRIMSGFSALMAQYGPERVYVEFPEFFDSATGRACAVGDQPDEPAPLQKLTVMVGRIAQVCYEHEATFVPVLVRAWKGQTPKPVIARRVARRYGGKPDMFPDHTMDAVALGLHLKGQLGGQRSGLVTNTPKSR